jgi:hypothetical protein
MNKFMIFSLALSAASTASAAVAGAQDAPAPASAPTRQVRGQTIVSEEMPRATLSFGKDLRHVGGQRVNLYGNAEAEQHLFVKAGSGGAVERFYWVQFEHFFPTNTSTYDYRPDRTTKIDGLQFIYDIKSWPDYAAMQIEDPASDGAAIARLLSQHGLSFPKRAVRVRMFHLPAPDRRTELMIIYGEALPEGSTVPVRKEGVALDTESPDSARTFLDNARKDLSIGKL